MKRIPLLGAFALALAISLALLTSLNRKAVSYDDGKDWWVLSFADPRAEKSLDFAIENHGDTNEFVWQVYLEKNRVSDGTLSVQRGEQRSVPVSAADISDKRITIVVSDGEKTKEIYKQL